MRIVKGFFFGLAILAILLAGGVIFAIKVIDPNDYKDKIQSLAMEKTGRPLSIDGDIGLSYFPWAGLSLGAITMANADGFGETPFVQIDGAQIKLKLLPLLKKSVIVDTVKIAGLKLDLERAADGRTNWDDLVTESESATGDQSANSNESTSSADNALQDLTIGSIDINDAQIRWKDQQNNTDALLTGFNLTSEAIELAKPFGLKTDFTLISDSIGVQAQVNGGGEISIDPERQQYQVQQLQLTTQAAGEAIAVEDLLVELKSDVRLDLLAQTATVSSLSVDSAGVVLSGGLDVTDLENNPTINAALKSNLFNPREVAEKLGVELPETHDPQVLKAGMVSMNVTGSASAAKLNDLLITLDDTTINGTVAVPDLTRSVPPIVFDFSLDAIDVDRYIAPAIENSTSTVATTEQASSTNGDRDAPIELPVDQLRQLDIDGIIKIGSLKVSNLTTQNIQIPINASNGKISGSDVKASLYEGVLGSSFAIDVAGAVPVYQFSTIVDKVQAEPLLQDLLQDAAPLSGEAIFSSRISTTGSTTNQLIANLNGQYNSDFTDGAINGINIGYQLRRAKSFFSNATETASEPVTKTDFSALHVSATINNGVIQSNDLDIRAPALRINGNGSVNLQQEYVDYTLEPKVVDSVEGQGGQDLDDLRGVAVSIPVQGTFDELSTDFTGTVFNALKNDFSGRAEDAARALAKQESDKLKAQAQEKVDAARLEANEKIRAEQARVERKVQEQVTAQKEKARQAADELKSKAEDKLKSLFK